MSRRTAIPGPISLPWRSPRRFTVSWACSYPFDWRASTRRSAGHCWQRWASGSRVLSPSTCTSIPPGRTPTRCSSWRFSCGTGNEPGERRTPGQWVILGLISGLVLDVYYANIAVLLVPFVESLQGYWRSLARARRDWQALRRLFEGNLLYCLATLSRFLAHLDHPADHLRASAVFGYGDVDVAHWASPRLVSVLFSSDHGLLTWTPILIPALVGSSFFAGATGHWQHTSSPRSWLSITSSPSTPAGTDFIFWQPVLHFTHALICIGLGGFSSASLPSG